ncbi:MAG TPA: IclR family transcriptional regulator [Bryobacteraceae bacterium]|nr:IclR family transcriptional regulator [Bryobacteraceae bacterium]
MRLRPAPVPGRKPRTGIGSSNKPAARDKNFIALTEKVFGVLEAFSENPQTTLSLEQITQSVGLAKTTVHRLLYSMKKVGYVDQHVESGEYMLAPKFFDLGRAVLPYQRVASLARPLLENLRLRCGESVHVGVLDKGLITYIAVVESQNPYRCAAVTGEFNYAHSTALGKCLLAYLPDEQIDGIIRQHGLPKLARNTITSGAQLLEELAKIREEGVSVNNEENIDGVICVAAPILDQDGAPVAALSVSGPAIRMELILDAVKMEVKRVASRISAMLGYAPGEEDPRAALLGSGHPPALA